MTVTAPSGRTKDERIAHLFLTGYSLDRLAEQGVLSGWTRADARRVAEANGWELDADGRIPVAKRTGVPTVPGSAAGPTAPSPANVGMDLHTVPVDALIARGSNHRLRPINTKAKRARAAIDDLRQALIEQIAADREAAKAEKEQELTRSRLAELDAERAQLLEKLGKKPSSKSTPRSTATTAIEHGTARGARQHIARGQTVCDQCKPALDEAMAAMRAKKEAQ